MTRIIETGEDYDEFMGRPYFWGNPYVIGRDGNRKEVVWKSRLYFVNSPAHMAEIPKLVDKNLYCPGNCKPRACHVDFLVELAEAFKRGGISELQRLCSLERTKHRNATVSPFATRPEEAPLPH